MRENASQARATSLLEADTGKTRRCKYKPCGVEFKPKRIDQVFHSPACKTKYTLTAYEKGVRAMERKGFRFAKLESSTQLQALYAAFLRRKPGEIVTTLQLAQETGLMSISTRVAELRANGIDISEAIYMGKSEAGARVYGYRLEGKAA